MNIDLPLLLRQKQALQRAMDIASQDDRELLEGVLNILDYLHDEADPPTLPSR